MDTCSLEQGRFSGPFEQNSRIQEAFKKHSSHVSWELHAAKIRFKSNTIDPCLEVLSFSLFWVISDSNSQKPSETHRTFFCSALCPLVEMRELSFGFVVVVEPRGGAKTWDLWLGRKNVFWRYLTLTALQISQAQKKNKRKSIFADSRFGKRIPTPFFSSTRTFFSIRWPSTNIPCPEFRSVK